MRTEYVRAREGNSLISIIVVVHRDRNISTKMRLQLRQREANANKAIRSRLSTIGCPPLPNSVRLRLRVYCVR